MWAGRWAWTRVSGLRSRETRGLGVLTTHHLLFRARVHILAAASPLPPTSAHSLLWRVPGPPSLAFYARQATGQQRQGRRAPFVSHLFSVVIELLSLPQVGPSGVCGWWCACPPWGTVRHPVSHPAPFPLPSGTFPSPEVPGLCPSAMLAPKVPTACLVPVVRSPLLFPQHCPRSAVQSPLAFGTKIGGGWT